MHWLLLIRQISRHYSFYLHDSPKFSPAKYFPSTVASAIDHMFVFIQEWTNDKHMARRSRW